MIVKQKKLFKKYFIISITFIMIGNLNACKSTGNSDADLIIAGGILAAALVITTGEVVYEGIQKLQNSESNDSEKNKNHENKLVSPDVKNSKPQKHRSAILETNNSDKDVCDGANSGVYFFIKEAKKRHLNCHFSNTHTNVTREKKPSPENQSVSSYTKEYLCFGAVNGHKFSKSEVSRLNIDCRALNKSTQIVKKSPPPSKSTDEIENERLRKRIAELEKKNKLMKVSKGVVLELQEILRNLNLYEGSIDGISGEKTLLALNKWLIGNGYPSVKYISKGIISRLKIHAPLTKTARKSPPPSKSAAELENERLRKRISELEKQNQSKPKQVAKRPSSKKSPPPKSGSTGSGFFVSKLGHILTNEHVVRQCGSVTVGDNANKQVSASVLEKDKRNDLALLRISSTQMASAETLSLISKLGAKKLGLKLVPLASGGLMRSDDIELGESVLVAGYPYGELYSNTIKVTGGMVSAVKGMGDDSAQFQMDAAVQPGNSGGPIYDENGNIVGVVISQLNKLKVAKAIGSLPENVNFGIKASTVRQFLTSAGLPTKWSNRTERKSTKELAQIAKNQTVMVVCNP